MFDIGFLFQQILSTIMTVISGSFVDLITGFLTN